MDLFLETLVLALVLIYLSINLGVTELKVAALHLNFNDGATVWFILGLCIVPLTQLANV